LEEQGAQLVVVKQVVLHARPLAAQLQQGPHPRAAALVPLSAQTSAAAHLGII
jgi:hypothetical protein